jgi:hypothetical protein
MKEKLPAPTKGVMPVMTGVSGCLMDSAPDDVLFGGRANKGSPYDSLLLQLKAAGHGKFLRFDDLRAKASVWARAKKMGIKVLFGTQGDKLWVSLAKVEMETDGEVDVQPKRANVDIVLDAVKAGRQQAGEIFSWSRSNGSTEIGIREVDILLGSLARAGKIKLKSQPRGSDGPERWTVAS